MHVCCSLLVKFDTYRKLQRNRAVLPAIVRLSCLVYERWHCDKKVGLLFLVTNGATGGCCAQCYPSEEYNIQLNGSTPTKYCIRAPIGLRTVFAHQHPHATMACIIAIMQTSIFMAVFQAVQTQLI